jgi:membrane protein YqaA with SNARE-associated domain
VPSRAPGTVEFYRTQQRYATARTAIKAAAWVACAYIGFNAATAFAGQSTAVAISLILTALVDAKFALSIALAGAACAWAVAERLLRHRKVEQMQGRLKELEKKIDPGRSSSGLTTKGQTAPKDRR